MSAAFADHFSAVATSYAQYRPTYPPELFDWIATRSPARHIAWDCACGSGQATGALAERFDVVMATDASAEQLVHAPAYPRVIWKHAAAETSGLEDHSIDAVTIAQALHWFDLGRFWPEVRRVVRPGGLVVAWSYGVQTIGDPEVDRPLMHYYRDIVGPWWPANRRHVDAGYTTLDFPFRRITVPLVAMRAPWTLDQFLGYVRSWSATQRLIEAGGVDPLPALAEALRGPWGPGPRDVEWPLAVVAGYVE